MGAFDGPTTDEWQAMLAERDARIRTLEEAHHIAVRLLADIQSLSSVCLFCGASSDEHVRRLCPLAITLDGAALDRDAYFVTELDRVQKTQRAGAENANLRAVLTEIRDCAKGIMPWHTDIEKLMPLIISFQDARWTRLFAIYSQAEKALDGNAPSSA